MLFRAFKTDLRLVLGRLSTSYCGQQRPPPLRNCLEHLTVTYGLGRDPPQHTRWPGRTAPDCPTRTPVLHGIRSPLKVIREIN